MQELFKYAFATNCHLDNDQVSVEDTETIDTFDSIDLLENFKDLILNLLSFKKESQAQTKTELYSSECFESLVKKYEHDIKYQKQVSSELLSQVQNAEVREKSILANYELAIAKIQKLESSKLKNKNFSSKFHRSEEIQQELQDQLVVANARLDSERSSLQKLEQENQKLKKLLEEKFVELEILRKCCSSLKSNSKKPKVCSIDATKKQLAERAIELVQNQQRLREKISVKAPRRDRNRENRRSCGVQDFSKLGISPQDPPAHRSHSRSLSEQKINITNH